MGDICIKYLMARCIFGGKGGYNVKLVKILSKPNSVKQVFAQQTIRACQNCICQTVINNTSNGYIFRKKTIFLPLPKNLDTHNSTKRTKMTESHVLYYILIFFLFDVES